MRGFKLKSIYNSIVSYGRTQYYYTNFPGQSMANKYIRRAVFITATTGFVYTTRILYERTLCSNASSDKSHSGPPKSFVESKVIAMKNFFKISIYRLLPWRIVSRTWGRVCSLENIPDATRLAVLRWYVKKYGVDLSEAERENIEDYACLSDLFRRSLKKGARTINPDSPLVSPSDGRIMVFGQIDEIKEILKQVKGTSFSLGKFIGPTTWNGKSNTNSTMASKIKKHNSTKTTLQYIVIYLSPGDYHRYHSPANWKVIFRRHFSGELLSVKPSVLAFINELFTINERVVYIGEWSHGFFSMTPVGATNVGSILVYLDPDLTTNKRHHRHGSSGDSELLFQKPLIYKKGENFGEFNLGSTIVLIFECPRNMEFAVNIGDTVKVGNALLKKI